MKLRYPTQVDGVQVLLPGKVVKLGGNQSLKLHEVALHEGRRWLWEHEKSRVETPAARSLEEA